MSTWRASGRFCVVCGAPVRYQAKSCCSRQCAMILGRMATSGYSPEWPRERIERLRVLWDEKHTISAIAAMMGTTRNAVVGKAHRLDLPARPSPIKRNGQTTQRRWKPLGEPNSLPSGLLPVGTQTLALLASLEAEKREAARKAPKPPQRRPEPPQAPPAPVSPFRTCQFPISDGRPWRFCDAPVDEKRGGPYCKAHRDLCVVPIRDRREDHEALAA